MDLLVIISYILFSMLLFVILKFLNKKFSLTMFEYISISLIYIIIVSLFYKYNHYIFLVSFFLMFTDILYITYMKEDNFFKNKNIIKMYLLIILSSFLVNKYLIDTKVIYLDKTTLRFITWIFIVYFVYQFIKTKDIHFKSNKINTNDSDNYDHDYVILSYTKMKIKYKDIVEKASYSNAIYASLVYFNNIRPEYLRKIDNFKFKLNNRKRPLGIMQIESTTLISDIDSIELSIKEMDKIYTKLKAKKTSKKEDLNYKLIKSYFKKYDYSKIIEIYDEISKF